MRYLFALLFLASLWFFAPSISTFFISIGVVWWLLRIDARILAGVGILFLASIPVLLLLNQNLRAEQLATYVFALMVIVLVLQIIELFSLSHQRPKEATRVVKKDIVQIEPQSHRPKRIYFDGIVPRKKTL